MIPNQPTNQSANADAQYNKMVNTPVWKLVTVLAIPTVISMLITAIYNTADTFFVSQLSTQASAAVGIVFPIMSIIQACGFTLGMGSGSLISIKLGQKKNDEATVISSTAFFTALAIGLLITIFGNIFSGGLLSLVGASESVLPYAKDYARFIFWGAPFMCASFVLNNVLRSEGKAFFSMIALTTGGIINIILDPFFIFKDLALFGGVINLKGFGLGISGAAIATLISQFISFNILFSFYLRRKSVCRMNIKFFSKDIRVLGRIVSTGFPSLARQGLASFATILLNTAAAVYGDSTVAAMTIATRIIMFVASMIIGIGQGFSPVSGYNYGAKRYDRVKKAWLFMVLSGFAVMAVFSTIVFIFAPQIIKAFRNDEAVIAVGTVALRWQIAFIPLHPLIIGTNMLMQSTRHVKQATFLSMNRQGFYFIPAILILPRLLGLFGVEISQAIADLLSTFTAIPYLVWFFRKLRHLESYIKLT
ncbi:MAG: MATE family efflux transporter [Treponema sp.]|nr:MATE family efflux transporter [Treponema sp.]